MNILLIKKGLAYYFSNKSKSALLLSIVLYMVIWRSF